MKTVMNARGVALSQISGDTLDLLVVGGGIVGSGVARDAAMRGLKVGLVERHDFAFGTSSRSSRLLHGGLRYLEQGRVGLVHEASVEKLRVHEIAPHLAQPLPFVFPVYRRNGKGRPMWQMRIGVKIYDWLCGGRNFEPSRGFSKTETLAKVPGLDENGLAGAVRYFDALTSDARLVIDTLRSAVKDGARVMNYARFADAKCEGDFWKCEVEDVLGGGRFEVKARTIVNATGPWAEELPHSQVKLRLSKGIHLVIDREKLPVEEALVLMEGKRLLFVIPWGKRLIVGTTDTDYEGKPEDVRVEDADVEYVLHTVNGAFPKLGLREEDVISSWAGLRPLVANPDGTPSDVSRAHEILSPERAWWDVTGGKLTTYRLMAEQTVDRVMKFLGRGKGECRTGKECLLGKEETEFSGLVPVEFSREAVEHFIKEEWAVSVDDVMVRRSSWEFYEESAEVERRRKLVEEWIKEI